MVALVCALAAAPASAAPAASPAAPPTSAQPEVTSDDAYSDPTRGLGATSPSCAYALDAQSRAACRRSGSAIHPHPLSSYGIDVRVGFSITDPHKSFLGAIQSLVAGAWMGLLYLMKGVLLLLEWSFSLDLTGKAMPQARQHLAQLHATVFGDSWLVLGIGVAGLWGMWRGLVQRRTTETLAGLAATIALMVAGLVVIAQPAETVGRAAQLANDAGMSVLSAATTGDTEQPRRGLVHALAVVFDTTARQPWCALEFGSTTYCDARTGDRRYPTNAELWLQYPAQSWQRDRLFKAVKGDGGGGFSPIGIAKGVLGLNDDRKLPDDIGRLARKDPESVRTQESGGTFPRVALLGVIAIGLLGAAALYAYIGIRLLLAGGMSLVLLLLAPAMLIAPAFGDAGRTAFLNWVKQLIGALTAKLVYSIFLAVILVTSRVFAELDVGWFGTWLLLAAFWWGIVIKRHEIVGFVTAGTPHSDGRSLGQALSHAYYGLQLGRTLRAAGTQVLAHPARATRAVSAHAGGDRAARIAATAALARDAADHRGRAVLEADHARAQEIVARTGDLGRERRALDRRLQGHDEAVATARAQGRPVPAPRPDQKVLLQRRAELEALERAPVARDAVELTRRAARYRAATGDAIAASDLAAFREQRLADIRAGLPVDHERNLRAAGVTPREYAGAEPEHRTELLARSQAAIDADRRLLEAGESGRADRQTRALLGRDELRARIADARREQRAERRRQRARQGVFRPR